jgi:hypothetical protein
MFGNSYEPLLGGVKILYYGTKQRINCMEKKIFFYQNEFNNMTWMHLKSNIQPPVFPLTGYKLVWGAAVIMAHK